MLFICVIITVLLSLMLSVFTSTENKVSSEVFIC